MLVCNCTSFIAGPKPERLKNPKQFLALCFSWRLIKLLVASYSCVFHLFFTHPALHLRSASSNISTGIEMVIDQSSTEKHLAFAVAVQLSSCKDSLDLFENPFEPQWPSENQRACGLYGCGWSCDWKSAHQTRVRHDMTRSAHSSNVFHLGNRSLFSVAALKKDEKGRSLVSFSDPFRRLKKTFAMRHAVCPKFASTEDVRQGDYGPGWKSLSPWNCDLPTLNSDNFQRHVFKKSRRTWNPCEFP